LILPETLDTPTMTDVWAARLQVVCDEKLGNETPEWVVKLAHWEGAPAWQRGRR
jgi:hypothetical protein